MQLAEIAAAYLTWPAIDVANLIGCMARNHGKCHKLDKQKCVRGHTDVRMILMKFHD